MGKEDEADVTNIDEPGPEIREQDDSVKAKSVAKARPWVRFFARMLDYIIFGWALTILSMLVGYPIFFLGSPILVAVLIFVWTFLEAGFVSGCATTPGKAILGVHIEKESGRKLSYGEGLSRSLSVWLLGMGAGLPIVYLVTWIVACVKLSNNGTTTWDKRGEIAVHYKKLEWYRIGIAIAIYVVASYLTYKTYA